MEGLTRLVLLGNWKCKCQQEIVGIGIWLLVTCKLEEKREQRDTEEEQVSLKEQFFALP